MWTQISLKYYWNLKPSAHAKEKKDIRKKKRRASRKNAYREFKSHVENLEPKHVSKRVVDQQRFRGVAESNKDVHRQKRRATKKNAQREFKSYVQ